MKLIPAPKGVSDTLNIYVRNSLGRNDPNWYVSGKSARFTRTREMSYRRQLSWSEIYPWRRSAEVSLVTTYDYFQRASQLLKCRAGRGLCAIIIANARLRSIGRWPTRFDPRIRLSPICAWRFGTISRVRIRNTWRKITSRSVEYERT